MRSFCVQEGSTSIKMGEKLLPQEFCTIFGSKGTSVEELWRNRDETTKNREEAWNPNANLLYGVARTYWCRWAAEVAAVSLDRFGLMQQPTSTEMKDKHDGGEARAAGGSRVEEGGEREKRMRKAGACLFIRKMWTDGRENRGIAE